MKSMASGAGETLESGDTFIKSLVEAEERQSFSTGFGANESLLERSIKAAQWKSDPLRIPDRDADEWKDTHPLAQIQWTWQKNKLCNGHYVHVVQALKWWRRLNNEPKYPKGYPVEHLIGQHCPDGITSVAQGVVQTLESIAASYAYELSWGQVPYLADHGVADHNVFGRVSATDFAAFHGMICNAASLAREACDEKDAHESSKLWNSLLGSKFPITASTRSSARVITPAIPTSESGQSGPRPLKDNPYFWQS